MNDETFKILLNNFFMSWNGYRKVRAGVKKRLSKHMQELNCRTGEEYLLYIKNKPDEYQKTRRLLTVSISRFFRDQQLWHVLERTILPEMVHDASDPISAWTAGCACGEETYTLKIILAEISEKYPELHPPQITATDLHPVYLEKAQIGVYQKSSFRDMPENYFKKYFQKYKNSYRAVNELKKSIKWIELDLFAGKPPGKEYHLVFLRNNVLTYYEDPVRTTIFKNVLSAIRRGGYLVTGSHESVPVTEHSLEQIQEHPCLFRKS